MLPERFWSKVDKDGPIPPHRPDLGQCWIWTAATRSDGYGVYAVTKKQVRYAHRVAYEDEIGPIPEGLEPDHLCSTPRCIRPAHLEPVTHRENLLRGMSPAAMQARQTHCKNGHAFDGDNYRLRRGKRECLLCLREGKQINNKVKTHCVQGHLLSESNVYLERWSGGVGRKCRTCRRETSRRHYLRRRAS